MNTVTAESTPALWQRWGTGLGIPAIVLMAVSFAFAANGPQSDDTDAKITSWYTSSSHQYTQMLAFVGFALGVLCLIGFLAALRERTPGPLGQAAFGAGVASAVLYTLALAFFTVPAYLASDASPADVAPASYRMFDTAAVVSWVGATMIAALTVAAISSAAFRTGLLPRWFAWLGVVVGLIQLLGFFFIPGFFFWGWVLIASVLLVRRASSPYGATAG